jgi:hypothetical protein
MDFCQRINPIALEKIRGRIVMRTRDIRTREIEKKVERKEERMVKEP